ncbi:hypothetical protein [Kitasatospora sp. NPDC093558]|uniref:hypothetical protein n=1 Tax=Kitasatospora sp. NPDC093558 TaxID=3155201 RepID=UPI003435F122
MASKKSTLVRAAVALCAVTAGGLAWAGLDTGAQASAVAPVATPASVAPSAAFTAPSSIPSPSDAPTTGPSGQAAPAPQSTSDQPAATGTPTAQPRPTSTTSNTATPQQAAGAPAAASGPVRTAPAPLPAAQLPDNTAAAWKPIAQPHTQATTHDIRLNECAVAKGATTWQQQGYVSAFKTPAIQDTFTFADAASAQQAYADLLSSMNTCQEQSRALQSNGKLPQDAQVSTTNTTAEGTAYARQWTAVPGISAPGPQTGHIYLVHHDNTLTALQFAIPAGTPGAGALTADDDRTTLTNLAAQLSTAATAAEQR